MTGSRSEQPVSLSRVHLRFVDNKSTENPQVMRCAARRYSTGCTAKSYSMRPGGTRQTAQIASAGALSGSYTRNPYCGVPASTISKGSCFARSTGRP